MIDLAALLLPVIFIAIAAIIARHAIRAPKPLVLEVTVIDGFEWNWANTAAGEIVEAGTRPTSQTTNTRSKLDDH